jgi:predicted DCC family thiol-disulfide oxidoreductase YuxK
MTTAQYILLFDGECNLCNRAVQIVIKHDKKEKFMFASLQSESAKDILKKYHLINTGLDTFILLK